jgi:cellobiose-specific phosphotransferase system component IIC
MIPGFVSVTTAVMARMPLVLIPAFFVPLFIVLHLAALFQARRAAAGGLARFGNAGPVPA